MQKKSIYSRRCWLNGQLREATVSFEKGVVTNIQTGSDGLSGDTINMGDAVVMPGVIDAHVHVNEPGRTDWEGFDSATKSAAAGGITTIVDMPLNASPVTTTLQAFKKKLEATQNKLHVNCGFYGGLVPGNIHELENLFEAGVLGIKAFLTHSGIDEFPNVTIDDLHAAMPRIAKAGLPLLVHCEIDHAHSKEKLLIDPGNYQNYLQSRPASWEHEAIELMIRLCRQYNCRVHIVHVSSSESVSMIASAKEEGLPLTAETCPHYIYFNAENIPDRNTLYKCAPPIREEKNNLLLKAALRDGVLDFLASDHSPAPLSLKEIQSGNLQKAWGGIAGLQFLLSAGWSALRDTIPIEKFIPLVTEHPAQFLQINNRKGYIKKGHDADFVIWSPEESFEVKEEAIFHKHKISPYVSQWLFGKIRQTYVNGHLVFDNGGIVKTNGGQLM